MGGGTQRGRRGHDAGFTLIEAVVALSVIGVVAAAAGVEVVTALRSTSMSRTTLVATELLAEQVEQARAVPFDRLAMSSADVAVTADSRLSSVAGVVSADIGGVTEPVYATVDGALSPHVLSGPSTLRAGTQFTVARYVTAASTDPLTGKPCQCRRVTVFATWALGARRHTRSTSTVVSGAVRGGLPSWSWSMTPPATAATNASAGGVALAPLEIVNDGVAGTWTLTATAPTGWSVRWYRDANANGAVDAGEAAVDTGTPGTGTTGTIRSGQVAAFVARIAVPSGAGAGDYSLRFFATATVAPTTPARVDVVVTL